MGLSEEWSPMPSMRWVERKSYDAVSAEYEPVPVYINVLQQLHRRGAPDDGSNIQRWEFEWFDVPIVEEET